MIDSFLLAGLQFSALIAVSAMIFWYVALGFLSVVWTTIGYAIDGIVHMVNHNRPKQQIEPVGRTLPKQGLHAAYKNVHV